MATRLHRRHHLRKPLFALLQSRQNRIVEAKRAHLQALLSTTESELTQAQEAIIAWKLGHKPKSRLYRKKNVYWSLQNRNSAKALKHFLPMLWPRILKISSNWLTQFSINNKHTQEQLGQGQKRIEETMEPVGAALHQFNERMTQIEQITAPVRPASINNSSNWRNRINN